MNNKETNKIIIFFFIAVFCLLPLVSFAQATDVDGLVPCDGPKCEFGDLIKLAQNIINFVVQISFPLAALTFTYAGFKLLIARDNVSERTEVKKMMWKTVIGFAVIIGAWLIVHTVLAIFMKDDSYTQFLKF